MLFFYSPDILERLANAQTFSVAGLSWHFVVEYLMLVSLGA
jgi:hypothetical protein